MDILAHEAVTGCVTYWMRGMDLTTRASLAVARTNEDDEQLMRALWRDRCREMEDELFMARSPLQITLPPRRA